MQASQLPGSMHKSTVDGAPGAGLSAATVLEAVRLGQHQVLDGISVSPPMRDAVWQAFRTAARRGEVSGRQLWTILEDVGASEGCYDYEEVVALRGVRFDAAVSIVAFAVNGRSNGGGAEEELLEGEGDAIADDDVVHEVRDGKLVSWLRNIPRRLQATLNDIRPQTLLLVASGAVIVFVGVVVTVAAAMAWLVTFTAAEEDGLRVMATVIAKMSEELEQGFVEQSAVGMVDVTVTTARTSEGLLTHTNAFAAMSQHVQTVAVAAAVGAFSGASLTARQHSQGRVRARLRDAYAAAQVHGQTPSGRSCGFAPAGATAAVQRMRAGIPMWLSSMGDSECSNRTATGFRTPTCSELISPVPSSWPTASCLQGLGVCGASGAHCVVSPATMRAVFGAEIPVDTTNSSCTALFVSSAAAGFEATAMQLSVASIAESATAAAPMLALDKGSPADNCSARSILVMHGARWDRQDAAADASENLMPESSFMVATASTGVPAAPAVRSGVSRTVAAEGSRANIVSTVDHLNWASKRTTEIVLGGFDPATGALVPQLNKYRFPETCFDECYRSPPSLRLMRHAIAHPNASGWDIHPDYRPWPVAGSLAYLPEQELGLVLERDVRELRASALTVLTDILDRVQHAFQDSMLVEVYQLQGAPPMPFYMPDAPCPPETSCVRSPNYGIVLQYACQHCQRLDLADMDTTSIVLHTDATKLRCDGNCTAGRTDFVRADYINPIAGRYGPDVSFVGDVSKSRRRSVVSRTSAAFEDPSGENADETELGVVSFIANLSVGVRVSIGNREVSGPLGVGLTASVLCALVLMVLGVLTVLGLSNETINALDDTWIAHQRDIRDSRERFGIVVREVIAPPVVQRLLAGESVIAEKVRVAIVGTDICSFSKYLLDHAPRKVVRLILYYREMLRELAGVYDLYRLHAVGDTVLYFTVRHDSDEVKPAAVDGQGTASGPPGTASKEQTTAADAERGRGINQQGRSVGPEQGTDGVPLATAESATDLGVVDSNHQVCRAMRFAASVMQMFSDETAHFPSSYPPLADLFPDVDKGSRRRYAGIPAVRVGCHWGTAVLSMVDKTNVIPQLDLCGVVVAAAHRLTLTVSPHEVGVTGVFRETLMQNDPSRAYTFGEPQRLMMRSVGWLTTFRLLSFKQRAVGDAVQRLGVAATPSDFPFDHETQARKSLHTVGIDQYRIKTATEPVGSSQGGIQGRRFR